MSLKLSVPKGTTELKPRIVVFGVGGAGGNAVNNMIQSNLDGVECVVANTDSQALAQSLCDRRIQLGRAITQGLGAGSRPDIGKASAEEGIDEILDHLQGSHMVFITAGMGGGTGTGAAPVIARAAREQGILTVGVVTKPFHFEGPNRMKSADAGIEDLEKHVDTLIVIPNQNLFRIATEKTTFADAFKLADDVLYDGVRGVTDLMVMPGLINLDFADIRTVMSEMGKAMMGAGEGDGADRARKAAEKAISNPLLDDVSMKGARGVLVNIAGGMDITLFEVDEAVNRIRDEVDESANIIFGSTFDDSMEGRVRVSIFATGIDTRVQAAKPQPIKIRLVSQDGAVARQGRDVAAPTRYESEDVDGGQGEEEPMPLTREHSVEREPEAVSAGRAAVAEAAPSQAQVYDEARAEAVNETRGGGRQFNEVALQPRMPEPTQSYGRAEASEGMAMATANARAAVAEQFAPMPEEVFEEEFEPEIALEDDSPAPRREHAPAYSDSPSARATAETADRGNASLFEVLETEDEEAAEVETRRLSRDRRPAAAESGRGLGGLDPDDRIASSEEESDLLEIPAFLRRQAN